MEIKKTHQQSNSNNNRNLIQILSQYEADV